MKLLTESLESRLREFHRKYGHYIQDSPSDVPKPVEELRIDLILEECTELFEAMRKKDLVEIADGAADLVYVVVGTCVSYGIPFDRIFSEVHRSNMTKTAIKVTDATAGEKYGTKTPKGPDYIAPDIFSILVNPFKMTKLEKAEGHSEVSIKET